MVAIALGVWLAWESADWPPSHAGWPVSFFVVALLFVAYLAAEIGARVRRT
jgi:zinc/manganese transport system permease protein